MDIHFGKYTCRINYFSALHFCFVCLRSMSCAQSFRCYRLSIFDCTFIFLERLFKGVRVMVLKTTFYSISVVSWRAVLMAEETGVPRENHRPAASH